MAWVTQDLIDVWKSGQFVGEHSPQAVVQVQLGHWQRGWYREDQVQFPPVKALIWGEGGYGPKKAWVNDSTLPWPGHWSAKWVPAGAWITVPNVTSIKRTRALAQNGITVLELVLDATDFVPKLGALGDAYHVISPGWLAPTRSYIAPGRPNPRWAESPWSPHGKQGRLTDSVTIRVWQGYGAPETDSDGHTPAVDGGSNGAWTFRGMVDDVDLDGNPNQITITARNGKLLTDQRMFRASKSIQIKDPVTFYDSLAATTLTMVAGSAHASSYDPAYPPKNAIDPPRDQWNANANMYKTQWRSGKEISARRMEWIEIRLPQGRYEELWIAAPGGLEAYVGVYAKPISHWTTTGPGDPADFKQSPALMDGREINGEGWVTLGAKTAGHNGGWPYVKTFTTDAKGITRAALGHTFELGNHSILRVGLLKPTGDPAPAQVGDLHALRRTISADVEQQQFILVDDASEVAKVVFRWAGYQDWEVEQAGVRLSDGTNYGPQVVGESSGRLVFNRQSFLIDVVQAVAKQLGFIFFLADPKDANSECVPTFRRDSSLLVDNRYIAANLNENTMLTGLKVKHTDEDRPAIIRVRGKTATARDGGIGLGGDSIRRITAIYTPPWGSEAVRNGGVLRHIVYEDDQLITYAMCLFGALMIGMNAALAMHTATAEIPGHPIIELDDQVAVLDEPTATNSRLWIVQSEDTMTLGEHAAWVQTIQGALLDTDDLQAVIAQVKGKAPVVSGTASHAVTIPRINWKHVIDPDSGNVSGYRSPMLWSTSRIERVR